MAKQRKHAPKSAAVRPVHGKEQALRHRKQVLVEEQRRRRNTEPEEYFEDAQVEETERGSVYGIEVDSDSEEEEVEQERTVLVDKSNISKYKSSNLVEASVLSKSYKKEMKTCSAGNSGKNGGGKPPASRSGDGGSRSGGSGSKSSTKGSKTTDPRTKKHKRSSTSTTSSPKKRASSIYSTDSGSDDKQDDYSRHSGDESSMRKLLEEERMKNELLRQRQRALQEQVLSVKSKKGKQKGTLSALDGLIIDTTKTEFFKKGKFLSDERQLEYATKQVLRMLDLQDFENLEGKDLERQEDVWVATHKELVRSTMNEWRNYIQGELFKLFRHLNSVEVGGGLDKVPNSKQILNIAKRIGMTKGKDANYDANMELFVGYWDLMVPKVAGHKDWGPGKRHHELMSFAHREDDPNQSLYVTPSDEAFLVLLWENCYDRWVYEDEKTKWTEEQKAADAKAAAEAKAKEEDYVPDTRAVPPYTVPKGGVSRFGGWNKAGRKRYRDILHEINESKSRPDLKKIEKEALALVRAKNNCDEKEAKRKKPKVVDKEEIDSDHEPDWMV